MAQIKFLDLDAVKPDTDYVISLNGTRHTMVQLTVANFLTNIRTASKPTDSLETQFAKITAAILRSFPTITKEEFEALTFDQLNQLREFAFKANGQTATEEEIEADAKTAGNPL